MEVASAVTLVEITMVILLVSKGACLLKSLWTDPQIRPRPLSDYPCHRFGQPLLDIGRQRPGGALGALLGPSPTDY